jgi:putative ABC transport system permease protein
VFAASATATIALGIAATVTVFSFINSIYLRPLPVPEGRRLVRIAAEYRPRSDLTLGYPAFLVLREAAKSFDAVAAHYSTAPLYMAARGESAEEMGAVVSADYFPMLGIRPVRGRFFLASEDSVPDRDAVAVIGHAMWLRRFGGEAGAVGEKITINGRVFTVIGVAPPGFEGIVAGLVSEVWIPSMMLRTGYRWCNAFEASCAITAITARLAPGVTLREARAELSVLAPRLIAATDPADSIRAIAALPSLGARTVQQHQFAQMSELLAGIAIVLLAVACANLSGLLLARGVARGREMAVRVSLGAGRGRLARQLLTESALIAGVGGAVGVLLSLWASRAIVGVISSSDTYTHRYDVGLDAKVLVFALLVSLITVLAFGLVPSLHVSRVDVADVLKQGWAGSRSRGHARRVLVTGQIVLALMLLIGAGLLTRSFSRLMTGSILDPTNVAILRLRPQLIGYPPDRAQSYIHAALDAVRRLPGIRSAVPAGGHLMTQMNGHAVISRPGEVPAPNAPVFDYFEIGPGFHRTFRIPLLAGREFTERDGPSSPLVAMVTESVAQHLWPDGNVVGRQLVMKGKQFEVIGVVKDYRWHNAGEPVVPMVFTAFWQNVFRPQIDAYIAIGVDGDPQRALETIRRSVVAVDPNVPVTQGTSMRNLMRADFSEVRLGGAVLVIGAALALFLSAIGLYGVVSFHVAQRRQEIGVRIAVGARPADVVALFVREGMQPIWIGGSVGLVTSLATAPLLSRWLFGIAPIDPVSVSVAIVGVTAAALLASYIPARRAARTDPAAVFRCD